jgi:hypothetical protein
VNTFYCRNCNKTLENRFADLGFSPPSNAYLTPEDYATASQIFNDDYAYFSSISDSWLRHASSYVDMITQKLELTQKSFVVEIASNDGYLLKNFLQKKFLALGLSQQKVLPYERLI